MAERLIRFQDRSHTQEELDNTNKTWWIYLKQNKIATAEKEWGECNQNTMRKSQIINKHTFSAMGRIWITIPRTQITAMWVC